MDTLTANAQSGAEEAPPFAVSHSVSPGILTILIVSSAQVLALYHGERCDLSSTTHLLT